MGAAASISWAEVKEDLSADEVRNLLGNDFNEAQFDEAKNKATGLLSRTKLMALVNSQSPEKKKSSSAVNETSPVKIGLQVPKVERRQHSRSRGRSFEEANGGNGSPAALTAKKKEQSQRSRAFGRTVSLEKEPGKPAGVVSQDHPDVDSWDSVHEQPSCVACGMLFPTLSKLEQHVKYSTIHAATLKKLDALAKGGEGGHFEAESDRCRPLYTGSKYFWRTQDNLDINIYLHIAAKCIEVIAFEGNTNFEFPRIYLDETKLLSMITEQDIWARVEKFEEEEGKKKFKKELPPRDLIFAEEKRLGTSSFILTRLKVVSDSNSSSKPLTNSTSEGALCEATKELLNSQSANLASLGVSAANMKKSGRLLLYDPLSNDALQNIDFDLQNSKASLTPVLIQRRRHSTDKEISDTISSITEMQEDIRGMTEYAEKNCEHYPPRRRLL